MPGGPSRVTRTPRRTRVSSSRSSKRDIEKARQEKAASKRQRRQTGGQDFPDPPELDGHQVANRPQVEVLAALAALHERFESGRMSFSDFESDKSELMR